MAMMLAAIAVAGIVVGAGPAGAHSDDGIMEVLTAESEAPLEITVEVGIVYADDNHLAIDAEVEVTASGPDGDEVGPIEMPNLRDAIYGATFEVPTAGTWSLEVISDNPEADATENVTVTDAPATTTTSAPVAPTTAEGDETPDETVATPTTVPPTTAPTTTEAAFITAENITASDDDDSDDDSNLGLIVAMVVVGLVAVGAVVALAMRARNQDAVDADGVEGADPDGLSGDLDATATAPTQDPDIEP